MARLTEPIDLKKLCSEGFELKIDKNFIRDHASSSEDEDDPSDNYHKNLKQQANSECIGVFDEDGYEEGEPFEKIEKKMFNLVPDGKIKKKIIRHGNGRQPRKYDRVKIDYNAYAEYDEEPFDSTYARHRPRSFTVGDGQVIGGLDIAVQSMKLGEKSQYLIDPDYAFGRFCLIGRVPANATLLFIVELHEVVNSGDAVLYEKLPESQKNQFPEIYKYCIALCEKGKSAFKNNQLKDAIKDYNTAATKLEKVRLDSPEAGGQHRELSLKIYSNLLICYTRLREPGRGCASAEKIYELTHNGQLEKISAKVYYSHAKCLRFLGEYESAKQVLNKAHKLEPKNSEIANEMLYLERDKLEHKKKQEVFAKALVGTSDNN